MGLSHAIGTTANWGRRVGDAPGLSLVRPQPVRETYFFVHTVRFWSMVGIIVMHSVGMVNFVHPLSARQMIWMIQPFKFGTIGFFLISGFLMGRKMKVDEPVRYLRSRLDRLLAPWLLWLVMLAVAGFGVDWEHHLIVVRSFDGLAKSILLDIAGNVAHSPYWFVPNLIVGMSCLLLLRKHLQDLRVGMMFLALNLLSVVNLYRNWLPSNHTQAWLGFVFYLWLGAWCAPRIGEVQVWIERIPLGWLGAAIGVSCATALIESFHLRSVPGADAGNTLRITNQIFSVCVVMGLMRLHKRSWPKFVDVPKQTYGLYLTHPLALSAGLVVMRRLPGGHIWMGLPWAVVPCAVMLFGLTYGLCVIVTNGLLHTPGLEWSVGGKAKGEVCERAETSERKTLPLRLAQEEHDNAGRSVGYPSLQLIR